MQVHGDGVCVRSPETQRWDDGGTCLEMGTRSGEGLERATEAGAYREWREMSSGNNDLVNGIDEGVGRS